MSGVRSPQNGLAVGQRVRYIEIIAGSVGGWTVRFTCCGTIHHRAKLQIARVRNNLSDQCDKCRIKSLRAQPIKQRGRAPC